MPEMRFKIQWPDGSQDVCYSPSLVIKDYFVPECEYALAEFVEKARTALTIASDRVQAKYGMPCSLALGQLRAIETKSAQYSTLPQANVRILQFLE
jgi:uncharacterized repeat protein (TIGR04042 family)